MTKLDKILTNLRIWITHFKTERLNGTLTLEINFSQGAITRSYITHKGEVQLDK
jgi:hypothetical protein